MMDFVSSESEWPNELSAEFTRTLANTPRDFLLELDASTSPETSTASSRNVNEHDFLYTTLGSQCGSSIGGRRYCSREESSPMAGLDGESESLQLFPSERGIPVNFPNFPLYSHPKCHEDDDGPQYQLDGSGEDLDSGVFDITPPVNGYMHDEIESYSRELDRHFLVGHGGPNHLLSHPFGPDPSSKETFLVNVGCSSRVPSFFE
eukprot:GHVO01064746.1.p1 GENE.GHVO01064746.1~~GHVO01064746.1.p1  ORF type:complete len:205 (+),score=11.59 GHVO01064746.1:450-1064(+)